MKELTGEHAFVHENLAAYLAGGLEASERARFDAHINNCPECFDAFTEARDADRSLQRMVGDLAADAKLEENILEHVREHTMQRWHHPILKRAAYATAAAVALAATGVFANFATHQEGRFNNPLTRNLAARADAADPELARASDWVEAKLGKSSSTANLHGIAQKNALADKTMAFQYNSATVESILTDMGRNYGFIVVKNATLPQKVTIQVPDPVDANKAMELMNAALLTQGYGLVQTRSGEGPDAKTIVRVAPIAEAKKFQMQTELAAALPSLAANDEMGRNMNDREVRQSKVSTLVADAQKLSDASQFKEAADLLHQATIIDPQDEKAALELRLVQNRLTSRDYEAIQHRTGQEVMRQNIDTNEHLIPYADLMVYPDNWAEIQRKQVGGEMLDSFKTEDRRLTRGNTAIPSDVAVFSTDGKSTFAGQIAGNVVTGRTPTGPREPANWGGLPAPAAPAPGIGGYLSYATDHEKGKTDDVGYEFGLNGKLRNSVDVNGNSIAMGNGGTPGQVAGWAEGGYAFNKETPGQVAGTLIGMGGPQVAITGGGGTGAITKTGAGTLNLGGNSGYTGGTSINSGTLNMNGGTITNGGTGYAGSGSVTLSSGSVATIAGVATSNAPTARGLADSGGSHAMLADSDKPAEGPVSANTKAPISDSRQSQSVLALGYKNNATTDLPAANLGLDRNAAARPGQPGASQNGAQVGYGDYHTEFTRWYDIKDLDTFYNDTTKAPNTNLFAAATPITPATPPAGGGASGTAPRSTVEAPDPQLSLKIIRNGTIEFEVRSFDDTYQRVSEIAAAERGFVSSTSSDKLANGHVRGTIVVRIPPERLDRFLLSLRSLGDLKAQQIGAADVTKQYYDIESELRGLTTMETRLLDLIKNGKGEVKDLIEAEKQLGDTRVRIEKLKGEISYYNNLVSLATITITAFEKDIASPTAASEQENVNLNVETEEVEAKYQAARKVLEDAKARIVESQLKNTDADHVAAHIVADVPPAQADFVANQLKQLGKVATFNRDRKQTTTGGTGAPIPGVQISQKDTRVTLELYNLANLAPRETTVLRVAVKDVEGTYKNVLGLVKTPPAPPAPPADGAAAPAALNLTGRVISSNLNGQQPEQMSADIRAELRSDNADTIIAALRGSGEVLTSSLNTNQDNAGTTSAKRGLQVTLVNIASVNPKEADNISIAVRDVDAAYKAALALIRKDAPPPAANAPTAAALALLPTTVGRVISSSMTGQQPVQMAADIRAEIRADQATELLSTLRGSGEIVSSSAVENPDTINVTRAKRGLAVHFVNVAAMDPREVQLLHGVAASVTDSYKALLTSLQEMAARGDVRIIGSGLTDTDPRTVTAGMTFEVQRPALDAVEKAFVAAGLEFPSRSTARANDGTQTLDSKVRFQIADIRGAETLDPKRTITERVEVENVEKSVAQLRKSLSPQGPKVRESDFTVTRDEKGRVIAHLVYDTYVSATPTVAATIDGLDGIQKSYDENRDPRAPETKSFTKERIDLTLTSRSLIVEPDQGIGSSLRAALSSAAGALLYSVYLVLTGLLFVLPFAVILWPIWIILKRRKAAVKA